MVAERLNIIGARIKKAGLQLAYHNHDFEFVEQQGQIGYDIITGDTDPDLVKLQMDLYWIARASPLTPRQWFEKHPGRFVMWHVKDMHKVSRDYTELGNGSIDFTTHLARRGARRPEALLRRAGRQLHPRSVPQRRRQRGVHAERPAEVDRVADAVGTPYCHFNRARESGPTKSSACWAPAGWARSTKATTRGWDATSR